MTEKVNEQTNWTVLSVIVIGSFMSALVSSIVNVALPKMMVIFGASADQIQWILTAYMLVLGVMMPMAGFLGDTFGYRRVYCFSLAVFTLGSGLCAVSWSLNSIVIARIIQALGGGLIQPLAMTLIYRAYPREKIGQILGIWGIAVMAAPAIGPTLGGYLVEYASWRWMFLMNVPLGVVCYFLAQLRLAETPLIKGHKFDLLGMITLVVGFSTLLLALSDGNKDGWTSPYIIFLLGTALVSLSILIYTEMTHPEPIVSISLLGNKYFATSVILGAIISMGMFGATFLMPMMLQNALGQSALDTGIILFPAALGAAVAMPIGGRLFDRYGARWMAFPGMLLITWTTLIMARFDAGTSFSSMTWWMTLRNAGMGIALMPIMTWGMNAVPAAMVGRASSISNVLRQIAASMGIAIFTSIMQSRQVFHYDQLVTTLNFTGREMYDLNGLVQSLATQWGLASGQAQAITYSVLLKLVGQISLIHAINDCFYVASGICIVGTLLALLVRDRKKSKDEIALGGEMVTEGSAKSSA